jgi:hypothetical protein
MNNVYRYQFKAINILITLIWLESNVMIVFKRPSIMKKSSSKIKMRFAH